MLCERCPLVPSFLISIISSLSCSKMVWGTGGNSETDGSNSDTRMELFSVESYVGTWTGSGVCEMLSTAADVELSTAVGLSTDSLWTSSSSLSLSLTFVTLANSSSFNISFSLWSFSSISWNLIAKYLRMKSWRKIVHEDDDLIIYTCQLKDRCNLQGISVWMAEWTCTDAHLKHKAGELMNTWRWTTCRFNYSLYKCLHEKHSNINYQSQVKATWEKIVPLGHRKLALPPFKSQ